jgi:hypothetical protein
MLSDNASVVFAQIAGPDAPSPNEEQPGERRYRFPPDRGSEPTQRCSVAEQRRHLTFS